jgi:hypothetical protein
MDPNLVVSMRKSLEGKSTAELRQAYDSGDHATWSPEALEAVRQILAERRSRSNKPLVALAGAVLVGALGVGVAWWQGCAGEIVLLAGIGGAILGALLFYIPNLIPFGLRP